MREAFLCFVFGSNKDPEFIRLPGIDEYMDSLFIYFFLYFVFGSSKDPEFIHRNRLPEIDGMDSLFIYLFSNKQLKLFYNFFCYNVL